MNIRKKEDITFTLIFTSLVCLVFTDILFLKSGFLRGDYLQQLYPWSKLYSEAIKNFNLSLWTRYVHSGFPLFAEGQIGQIYPLNILMFFLLPFRAAYNYSFLAHFVLNGVFTYMLARKKGADLLGGAFAAVLVIFGSGYAGCFIHISALRCLTWFPLTLLLYDRYLDRGKRRPALLFLGLVMGMQLVSGSMQMAVYSIFFSSIYFFYRTRQERFAFRSLVGDLFIALTIGILIASPQIMETITLTGLSNRKSLMDINFAMWNSLSPITFSGLILPYVANLFAKGNMVYIGTMGLFFAVVSLTRLKRKDPLMPLVWIIVFSVFIALGKYNPLYVLLVKFSAFYSFRAPARAVYFAFFALSVLAGVGFSGFFNSRDKISDLSCRIYQAFLAASIGLFLAAKGILSFFGPHILRLAKDHVGKNIYGRPFHRYDLDSYISRTEAFYLAIQNAFSLRNQYVVGSLLIILLSLVLIYFLARVKKPTILLRYTVICFVFFELWFFSLFSKGIRPELDTFGSLEPRETSILKVLREDREIFRICPFGDFNETPLWLRPSLNAYYDMDSISIYSPLTNRDYFLEMKGLGTVDDSLGIFPPEEEVLSEKLDVLRKLNVKYIISMMPLDIHGVSLVVTDNGKYLYEITGFMHRFWISSKVDGKPDGSGDADIISYSSGFAEVDIESKGEAFLVFSEKNYPGWKASVNGTYTDILPASGLIQAVRVGPGQSRVIFSYRPEYLNFMLLVSIIVFMSVLGIAVWKRKDF